MTSRAASVLPKCARCRLLLSGSSRHPSLPVLLRRQGAQLQFRHASGISARYAKRDPHLSTENERSDTDVHDPLSLSAHEHHTNGRPQPGHRQSTPDEPAVWQSRESSKDEELQSSERSGSPEASGSDGFQNPDPAEGNTLRNLIKSWESKPLQSYDHGVKKSNGSKAAPRAQDELPFSESNPTPEQAWENDEPFWQDIPDIRELQALAYRGSQMGLRDQSSQLVRRQNIGLAALGKPVGAIMRRNPNDSLESHPEPLIVERDDPIEPIDLEKTMSRPEKESGEVTAEVFRNIDELRPNDETVLSARAYQKIQRDLVHGFYLHQLQAYVRANSNMEEKKGAAEYKWVVKSQPWALTFTATESRTPMTAKPRVVAKIMHNLWHLESQEKVNGIGKTTVWLKSEISWLVARPDSPLVKSLRADLLDEANGERMWVSKDPATSLPTLQLESKRSTAYAIMARLDDAVNSIVSRTILGYGSILKEANRSPENLETLAELTHTKIVLTGISSKDKAGLTVYWQASPDRPEPLSEEARDPSTTHEDPADIVLRLLVTSMRDHEHESEIVFPTLADSVEQKYELLPYQRSPKGLSSRHKLLSGWSRYMVPISKHETPRLKVVAPKWDLKPFAGNEEPQIMATFGHVLNYKTKGQNNVSHQPMRRTLLPCVCHPAAFTAISSSVRNKDLVRDTSIVLKFEEDPSMLARPSKATRRKRPWPVRIKIPVGADADLANFVVPADVKPELVGTDHADLCFATIDVDARLTQERVTSLPTNEHTEKLIAACELNLAEGRLRVPSRARFMVPRDPTIQTPSKWQMIDVPYLFVGLEIHQSIKLPWQGHTLQYRSIEAGLHGGQRQEITLLANLNPQGVHQLTGSKSKSKAQIRSDEFGKFVDLVAQVAASEYFPWVTGATMMGQYEPQLIEETTANSYADPQENHIPSHEVKEDSNLIHDTEFDANRQAESIADHDLLDDELNMDPANLVLAGRPDAQGDRSPSSQLEDQTTSSATESTVSDTKLSEHLVKDHEPKDKILDDIDTFLKSIRTTGRHDRPSSAPDRQNEVGEGERSATDYKPTGEILGELNTFIDTIYKNGSQSPSSSSSARQNSIATDPRKTPKGVKQAGDLANRDADNDLWAPSDVNPVSSPTSSRGRPRQRPAKGRKAKCIGQGDAKTPSKAATPQADNAKDLWTQAGEENKAGKRGRKRRSRTSKPTKVGSRSKGPQDAFSQQLQSLRRHG